MKKQKQQIIASAILSLTMGNCFAVPATSAITDFIKVDQFGYKTWDIKIAVISDPQTGYNGSLAYTPGTIYEVRNWNTGTVALNTSGLPVRGSPVPWKAGATHAQSGDKVWWYYFSDLQTAGSYYIYDTTTQKASGRFEINNQPFQSVMKAAIRMLFYQRANQAKSSPYVDLGYIDSSSHVQDATAKPAPLYNLSLNSVTGQYDIRTRTNPTATTPKNLSGGWYDAGDYSKYVNFIWHPMLDLLLAYEERPSIWSLNLNIPESTNTIPDILDEVKYELDWLLKMQSATGNGSVLSVVGTEDHATASPPSMDKNLTGQNVGADGKNHTRYYGRATTMATYTAASVFALASIQFRAIGQTTYANTLLNAAKNAWTWAAANPGVVFNNNYDYNGTYSDSYYNASNAASPTPYTNVNFVASGNQEIGSGMYWAVDPRHYTAAAYLYAASKAAGVTPITAYQQYIDNNWNSIFNDTVGVSSDTLQVADASLYYTKTTGATAAVKTAILDRYTNSMTSRENNMPSYDNANDAYLAYISIYDYANWSASPPIYISKYDWGSNVWVGHQAASFLNMMTYNLDPSRYWEYYNAAAGYLHYMHGVNPNSKVYLTNMGQFGAENSVTSIFHNWFTDGSALWDQVGVSTYGPPPGYVPGGPDQFYANYTPCSNANPPTECLGLSLTPPLNQPGQKSWRDFNTDWPANTWTVTEPQIYYQAAYIRMLSKFM